MTSLTKAVAGGILTTGKSISLPIGLLRAQLNAGTAALRLTAAHLLNLHFAHCHINAVNKFKTISQQQSLGLTESERIVLADSLKMLS